MDEVSLTAVDQYTRRMERLERCDLHTGDGVATAFFIDDDDVAVAQQS